MRVFAFCIAVVNVLAVGYSLPNIVTSKVPVETNSNKSQIIAKTSNYTNLTLANVKEAIFMSDDEYRQVLNGTRRIMEGHDVRGKRRPYMVYLQLTQESAKGHKYRGWLCGGVIVHKYYVLTSAACVEDAEHFYIVSGTHTFVDSFDYLENQCAAKNRRKVIWKCIPRNYRFDFDDSSNWATNDIAIVKVERPFTFGKIERGCSFAVHAIKYNNISQAPEKPHTKGFIAGWGSKGSFREGVYRRSDSAAVHNSKCLQEANVELMDTQECVKRWAPKYKKIILEHMLCTKDVSQGMSAICNKKYANCTEVIYHKSKKKEDVEDSEDTAYQDDDKDFDFRSWSVDTGRHLRNPDDFTARRSSKGALGGFCENDHGGPLITKHKGHEMVIGVISACKINPKTHICHGPFLYTSVFKNRQFLSCSISKDVERQPSVAWKEWNVRDMFLRPDCRRVFRAGITHNEYDVSWRNHPDGPADNERDEESNEDSKDDRSQSDTNKQSDLDVGKDSDGSQNDEDENDSRVNTNNNREKSDFEKQEDVREGDESYVSSKEEDVNEPDDE